MKLTPEEIGKKTREFYPKSYPEWNYLDIGNFYISRYGDVDDPSKKGDPNNSISATGLISSQGKTDMNLIMKLIQQNFPQNQWQNAYKVAQAESGLNPRAIGDNYPIAGEVRPSYGLFQIRTFPDRPAPEQLLDPETNVAYAAKLFKQQGWKPWSVSKKLGLL